MVEDGAIMGVVDSVVVTEGTVDLWLVWSRRLLDVEVTVVLSIDCVVDGTVDMVEEDSAEVTVTFVTVEGAKVVFVVPTVLPEVILKAGATVLLATVDGTVVGAIVEDGVVSIDDVVDELTVVVDFSEVIVGVSPTFTAVTVRFIIGDKVEVDADAERDTFGVIDSDTLEVRAEMEVVFRLDLVEMSGKEISGVPAVVFKLDTSEYIGVSVGIGDVPVGVVSVEFIVIDLSGALSVVFCTVLEEIEVDAIREVMEGFVSIAIVVFIGVTTVVVPVEVKFCPAFDVKFDVARTVNVVDRVVVVTFSILVLSLINAVDSGATVAFAIVVDEGIVVLLATSPEETLVLAFVLPIVVP